MSDRAPVLVGVAQYVGRETDPTAAPDPLTMMIDVATRAAYNTGVGQRLFGHVDTFLQIPLAYWTPANGAALTAEHLGIDPRPFTVTGGLPCAGGPGSAYNMNSIAAMVERLREEDGSIGLVTGNVRYDAPSYAEFTSEIDAEIAARQLAADKQEQLWMRQQALLAQ